MFPFIGYAQVDSLKNEFQKEFDSFSRSIQQDFDSFQRKNDSIFIEFLGQSWKTFEAFISESGMKPKPKEQPVREKSEFHPQPIKPGNIRIPIDATLQEREKTENFDEVDPIDNSYNPPSLIINFYGSDIKIIPPKETLPRLQQVSPLYFVEFFEKAASSSILTENVRSLQQQAKGLNLNDWGFICLFKTTAEELFQDENEQTLFIWFGLLRCGYNVKTGYNKDKVYLLAPSSQDLYNTIYFNIRNKLYFLLKLDGQEVDVKNLNAYEADYPGNETSISLMLYQLPKFDPKKFERKVHYMKDYIIEIDQNLVDFFSIYPECDLIVSMRTPLSDVAVKSLKSNFRELFSEFSNVQKVEYLLKFIQYGIPYKTDEEQFGKENYLFPEEVLYFPQADCEDRAALFARLVESFTEFKAIILCYPDHVTAAVNLPGDSKGAYLDYKGQRYYICDPTYIGAEIGMSMPEYENVEPELIVY